MKPKTCIKCEYVVDHLIEWPDLYFEYTGYCKLNLIKLSSTLFKKGDF